MSFWFLHESATCVHVSPPSWTSLPPRPTLPGCHRALGWAPGVTGQAPTRCFAYGNVYVSTLLSQFVPPSPSRTVSTSLLSMSASRLLPAIVSVFNVNISALNSQRRSSKTAQFGYHSLSVGSCGSFFSQQKRMREGTKQGLMSGSWTEKKGSQDSGMILRNSTLIRFDLELHRRLR